MIAFLLFLLATTLFLVAYQADGYYIGVYNDCNLPGEITASVAFFNTTQSLVCYEKILMGYEEGAILLDSSESYLETDLPFFWTYATLQTQNSDIVWDGSAYPTNVTITVPCGSTTDVTMAPVIDVITQQELAAAGVTVAQDVLLAEYKCGTARRALQDEDEDDCDSTLTQKDGVGCLSSKLSGSKKDFILHHLQMLPPNCENKDHGSCMKDLHHYRRFLRAMQK